MQILTQYDREQIAYSLKLKRGVRTIARLLKRDPGVISRELQRNRLPDGRYDPVRAQKKADLRARKTNRRKLETDWRLHDWVERKLIEDWSPELIAGRLKGVDAPTTLHGATVSHEQIYRYIYEGAGRFEGWYRLLHRKQRRRRPRFGRKAQKPKIPERVSIHDRPRVIDERGRYGDWESDEMEFQRQRPRLSVQYERKAMATRLHRVADKTAEENDRAIRTTFDELPERLRKSLTFDNGLENVCHTWIRDAFRLDTFFCDPYSAWQKGGVENAIGLLRRYLPKGADLSQLTDDDLHAIEEKLNNRPRKKLHYRTPNEVLGVALNS